MTATETRYTVSEQIMLSAMEAIKKLHYYLTGRSFTLISTHPAVKYLTSSTESDGRLHELSVKVAAFQKTTRVTQLPAQSLASALAGLLSLSAQ